MQSYLLSEFCIATACHTVRLDELTLRPHEAAVGCIADLCAWKPDVLLKLRAGYVCPAHKALLQQLGATSVHLNSIERVLELVRAYALGRDDEKRRLGCTSSNRVFLVHGRDEAAHRALEALVCKFGLEPVSIIRQAAQGRTVIEQIEAHSDVRYAIVLITPDDEGRLSGAPQPCPRARQNVVLECGLFIGLLGRPRVCCLVKEGPMELPTDLDGLLQVRFSRSVDDAAMGLAAELQSAGYQVTLR